MQCQACGREFGNNVALILHNERCKPFIIFSRTQHFGHGDPTYMPLDGTLHQKLCEGQVLWPFAPEHMKPWLSAMPYVYHSIANAPSHFVMPDTWYEIWDDVKALHFIAKSCGVRPQLRLSDSFGNLAEPLRKFLCFISPYRKGVGGVGRFSLKDIAEALDKIGVATAIGRVVRESPLSNCFRRAIEEAGPAYRKIHYEGKNHLYFNSTPAPMKEFFGQEVV